MLAIDRSCTLVAAQRDLAAQVATIDAGSARHAGGVDAEDGLQRGRGGTVD